LILHTEVHWLSKGKVLFKFQEIPETGFLQNRGELPLQLKYSQLLLDLVSLTNLTTEMNELITELQDENETIIKKMNCTMKEKQVMEDSADEWCANTVPKCSELR
jgi:hypothetical protein